jgi:PTS system mannose-specific IIC component
VNVIDLLPFVLLGAIAGLDVVSFPQAMISRPLVAATIGGALAGDAERGLVIGAVVEMVALGTLPFGASRYPDWGSASVVGGALYAQPGATAVGHLTLAVFATLLAAWLSSQSMVWHRQLNGSRARRARPLIAAGNRRAVERLLLGGIASDLVRGGLVTLVALLLALPAFDALAPRWSGGAALERVVVSGLTAALGAATVWMLVRGAPAARPLLVAGLAMGALAFL